jgi:hypothetical protein
MKLSSLSTQRAVVASIVAAVQLLSVGWGPVAHAELAGAKSQAALEDAHTRDCLPVHNEALCLACASANLGAPTSGAPAQFSHGDMKWILSPRGVNTAAWPRFLSTANLVRAPPVPANR